MNRKQQGLLQMLLSSALLWAVLGVAVLLALANTALGEARQTQQPVSTAGLRENAGQSRQSEWAGGSRRESVTKDEPREPPGTIEAGSAGLPADYFRSLDEAESKSSVSDELKQLIVLVKSLKFGRQSTPAGPAHRRQAAHANQQAPQPPAQPDEPPVAAGRPVCRAGTGRQPMEPNAPAQPLSLPYKPVSPATAARLKAVAENGTEVVNPAALGEVLFRSSCPAEAALFYQIAMERTKPGQDEAADQQRAWLLFQIGNCYYQQDPSSGQARQRYEQLLAEYPSSPWAAVGAARRDLIDLHQKDGPLAVAGQSWQRPPAVAGD
jgi:hypothetical protein